jgi:hypothetical protein
VPFYLKSKICERASNFDGGFFASSRDRPDLDRVDLEGVVISLPSIVPDVFSGVERIDGMLVVVGPGFVALSIREVISGTSNSQIDEQIEFSVERSIVGFSDPRVGVAGSEITLLEEAL